MADVDLIEQIRAQVKSLKSPRQATPERGTNETNSSGGSSRGRLTSVVSGQASGGASRVNHRITPSPGLYENNKSLDNTVILDVGGVKYRTTYNTLKCIESSYFCHLFDGMWDPLKTEEGHLFIDRNGELFGIVLEYLRNFVHNEGNCIELPMEISRLKALKREADFYILPGLTSQINTAIQDLEERERLQSEMDTASSVVVKEEETSEKEVDIIFHSISSTQCSFSEDRIQDLVGRVNYSLASKEADGYKMNSTTSDLIYDASKTYPYTMFMQITLIRDRKPAGLSLPMSTSSERPRNVPQQMPMTSYTQSASCEPALNDGMEYPSPPQSRRMTGPRTPRAERQVSSSRYPPPGDFVPDTMYAPPQEGGDLPRSNYHRWNYRPRYVDQGEWEGNYEIEHTNSPRGAGHYQPSPHVVQRKHSGRAPLTRPTEHHSYTPHKYPPVGDYMDNMSGGRGGRHDGWVNQVPSVQ